MKGIFGMKINEMKPSVTKFGKLGGKVSLTDKINTSSKNRNYIHQMVISLSKHWPGNNSISFKHGYLGKTTKNDIYPPF